MTHARSAGFAVGGRRPVAEAIRSGRATRVLIARGSRRSEGLRSVLGLAGQVGLAVEWVGPRAIESLGLRDHQGVAAIITPPRELELRGLASWVFEPDALVVVLDGIMDPQNFGACVRSAEAAGAAMLITRTRRAAPLSAAAVKASAGALLHLPVARVANISRALEDLKDRGFHVVGLDHRARSDIHEAPPPPRPLALVVGAEDVGLSRLVRESCDELIAIPMTGKTSSLNASAALAVALFGYALRPQT
ncbi:MAG TPA: 23S rRNA (guanosine(2251)-2'-O)-methyltransferase RlmB [Actinomycetota bacterium]|nr:23S rRNA (guanosine(2251)-2'-O)-methyltransferase RlmB [Actinomycetota bacterium]